MDDEENLQVPATARRLVEMHLESCDTERGRSLATPLCTAVVSRLGCKRVSYRWGARYTFYRRVTHNRAMRAWGGRARLRKNQLFSPEQSLPSLNFLVALLVNYWIRTLLPPEKPDFAMGQPSFEASNAIIYLTYEWFLYFPSDFVIAFLSVLGINFIYCSTIDMQAFG